MFQDVGIQTTPPPTPTVEPRPPIVKTLSKQVVLAPPPLLNFEKTPIAFKGIPLEAAQWTFSSAELQEVVGRAIRLSARESFVRILPIETLDVTITAEKERLDTLKMTTQSQYRFQVFRRTMLLQALTSSASAATQDPDAVCSLASQLSETTAACDRLMEELLRVADQQAQISKVLDLHWASALAIALRKINKSYEKRVGDLRVAQDRVEVLEAELSEAWKEAEDIAQEMDELEDAGWEDEEDVTVHTAHVVGVTARMQATEAKLMDQKEASSSQIFTKTEPLDTNLQSPMTQDPAAQTPTATESGEGSQSLGSLSRSQSRTSTRKRSIRVTAAKTRSRRTSDASLRVTKSSKKKADGSAPPVPKVPIEFDSEENFIDFDPNSPVTRIVAPRTYISRFWQPASFTNVCYNPGEKHHPYASGANTSSVMPAFWISADSPQKPKKTKHASVQPPQPNPLMRRDSSGRSISRYSHSIRPKTTSSRHSLPPPAGGSEGHSM